MAKDIKIPQIAEGVDTAKVSEILVAEGDSVEKDQSLITVESDKAAVDIPSPEAGTIKSIKISEGDDVSVGDVIMTIEDEKGSGEDGDEKEDDTDSKDEKSEKKEKAKDKPKEENDTDGSEDDDDDEDDEEEVKKSESKDESEGDSEKGKKKKAEDKNESDAEKGDNSNEDSEGDVKKGKSEDEKSDDSEEDEEAKKDNPDEEKKPEKEVKDSEKKSETSEKTEKSKIDAPASPGVRRFARELGVDLSQVKGSGEDGRISKEDIKNHNKGEKSEGKSSKSASLPDFSKWGEIEKKPLSGIRSATAKNTATAWNSIPHVFQFDESDISGIEGYMEKNKEKAEEAGGHLTITAILVKITAGALRQFPKFNSSIDMENEEIMLKKYVNIGVAVDTEKGLLVPVIKNADQKTILDISREITQLAEKARGGKLSAEEMQGGTFTISNLGGIGGTNFTPIVYHPQAAILGISRAKKQPIYVNGELKPRDILPLSLSYDHRIIDGAEGVRFINYIARALEDPYKALLGA